MLPRHLRRSIPTSSSAFRLATNASRSNALTPLRYRPAAGAIAPFHSSSRQHDELPKSPFQTFVDVLRDELRKNRELQENVKQLQGDVDKFQDSETMRKARAAYERARVRCIFPRSFPRPSVWKYNLLIFIPAHF
jgi:mitochondrial import inner membrane translocase subunit TIM44